MPENVIEKFEVKHLKILDEKGNADTKNSLNS